MRDLSTLHTLVFNSLDQQIAVINQSGTIVDVNSAWVRFGLDNGLAGDSVSVGINYLDVLRASEASGDSLSSESIQGISEVLNSKRDCFDFEYPCHTPEQKRWFRMHMTGLHGSAEKLFVISHQDITQRKLAEEKAEYLSRHDSLTGLANRRHFNEVLHNEMQRSLRGQSTISLMLIDVDHFKDYNDELGHLAGDHCLAKVGQVLLPFVRRPGDLAARIGGDEFALLLGDTDFTGSQMIADTVRNNVSTLDLPYDGCKGITVSIGVFSSIPHLQQTETFLLEMADNALYKAKSAGRNRVVHDRPSSDGKVAPANPSAPVDAGP